MAKDLEHDNDEQLLKESKDYYPKPKSSVWDVLAEELPKFHVEILSKQLILR